MDFRRADPNYVNFVPKTCVDAIDLFNRHRNLGLTADLYPECFVHCARALPGPELDMFHRFIVTPNGDIEKGGEKPTQVDVELEKERKLLLEESEARDGLAMLTIKEDYLAGDGVTHVPQQSWERESPTEPMSVSQEDEKCPTEPMSEDEEKSAEYIKITSAK